MGDDYDILCIDMLEELIVLCETKEKASKKVRSLTRNVCEWQKRRKNFEAYRSKFTERIK